jgi:transglutaminase-like putative cysteine protease
MRIPPLLIALCCCCFSTIAQKNADPSPEEINTAKSIREKYDKFDIAILNSTEKVTFSINKSNDLVEVNHSVKEHLMNINHRADIQKYEFYDSQSVIENFSLKYKTDKQTNFLVNDEFYKSDDLFYNDARVKYMQVDFPVQGYTYKYHMDKKIKDSKYFTSIYLSDEFPIIQKTVVVEVPKWLELEIKEFNFNGFSIKKTSTKNDENTIYTYTIEQVNGMAKEHYSPGPSYLYPHLLFIAKSFVVKNEKKQLFITTTDLYKWYKSLVDSMKDDPSLFTAKVKELTATAKTDEEKIKNIYYWVQDNIRYIAFEDGIAGFKPDDSQNVFQKRYGDCKGMANLTKQMLKAAGFDARLCWIGTNHIAYDYTTPSLSVDNHMICALFKNGKRYFLDGTEKYNSLGEYAERIQGKEVLIEDGTAFIIDKIPVQTAFGNTEKSNISYTLENETLKGSVTMEFLGESRASFLYNYNTIKNDKKDDALKWYLNSRDKNCSVSNIKTSDLLNRDQKLTLNYEVAIANHISSFDNEIYIDLNYDKEYASFDFKDRKTDFILDYKSFDDIVITLQIPEGYKVSKVPNNIAIKTDDYSITMNYEVKGTTLKYTKQFLFKNGIIKSAKFDEWKNHYAEIQKNYAEQVVLTK